MKYLFEASLVVDASGVEDALRQVRSHIATATTHVANGRKLEECESHFTLEEADSDAEAHDLKSDPIVKADGPYKLTEAED